MHGNTDLGTNFGVWCYPCCISLIRGFIAALCAPFDLAHALSTLLLCKLWAWGWEGPLGYNWCAGFVGLLCISTVTTQPKALLAPCSSAFLTTSPGSRIYHPVAVTVKTIFCFLSELFPSISLKSHLILTCSRSVSTFPPHAHVQTTF